MSLLLFLSIGTPNFAPALGQEPQYITQVREHINKGNALLGRRLFAEAIGEYQKALDLDASNIAARRNIAETHNNWGIYWYSMRRYNDAMREWEITLELEPNHFNAKRNLVLLKQFAARQGIKLGQSTPDSMTAGEETGPGGGTGNGGTSGSASRGGSGGNSNSAPARTGMQGGKEDTTQPSAIMILTPNIKVGNSTSSEDTSSSDSSSSATGSVTLLTPTKAATASPAGAAPASGTAPASGAAPAAAIRTPATANKVFTQTDPNGGPDDFEVAQPPVQDEEEKPPPGKSKNKKKQKVAAPSKSDDAGISQSSSGTSQGSKPAIPPNLHPSSAFNKWAPAITKSAAGEEPTIEDELKLLENKVYGQVQELPVLKRLEKLEKDTTGKVSSGPVRDRIQSLRQHYGI